MQRLFAFSILVLVASLLSAPAWGRFAQPFEGTKWKVTVTPDDDARKAGKKEFNDVLVFKGNKFVSEACVEFGFKPVEYEEEMSPGGFTASFTAEPKSEKEGTAKWRGTKTGTELTGELLWTTKDGDEFNYTFKGERM